MMWFPRGSRELAGPAALCLRCHFTPGPSGWVHALQEDHRLTELKTWQFVQFFTAAGPHRHLDPHPAVSRWLLNCPPTCGLRLSVGQVPLTEKRHQRSFDIIGTFYSSGRYTLAFLAEQVGARSCVSMEDVHLRNCTTAPPQGPAVRRDVGAAASSSGAEPACWAQARRAVPLQQRLRLPPQSRHERLSPAALGAVPSLACICGGEGYS
ncbi:hypothetical protein P7K49_015169 [Saguinus oedipus]|uniref:Uncharacterized protein n=1 Tax=Saguinus oedipus TaxID=9490 RepID=A0ABQ9V900_SAGOE|nr:hypothetical protein P7K49_015169 [Saguinus oedipus]